MSRTALRVRLGAALARVEGWARPSLHLVPPWGRSLLRRASDAAVVGRSGPAVSAWDRPLISGSTTSTDLSAWTPASVPADSLAAVKSSTTPRYSGMRCLIATECIDVGGMDEVVATLADALHGLGMVVAVAHVPLDPSQPVGRLGQALADRLPVVTLTHENAQNWVQNWQPDVVSVHGTPTWFVDLAAQLAAPVVETLHGPFDLFPSYAESMRARSSSLAAVVAVSSLVRAQFLQLCPDYPQGRVVTIPNGIRSDLSALPSRARARQLLGLDREFLFVSTARHCLQKNTYGLLAAFLEVAAHEDRAHLVIAGRPEDPSYMRHLTSLVGGSSARDRVHLRDHLPSPLPLLAAADSFVLNSFFEGWSLASMEAVAAGVPVVLSDVGGAREQVTAPAGGEDFGRRSAGFLVPNPSGSPVDLDWEVMNRLKYADQANRGPLVAAMLELVRAPDEWRQARKQRLADARGRFSLDVAMRRHAEVLSLVSEGLSTAADLAGSDSTAAATT